MGWRTGKHEVGKRTPPKPRGAYTKRFVKKAKPQDDKSGAGAGWFTKRFGKQPEVDLEFTMPDGSRMRGRYTKRFLAPKRTSSRKRKVQVAIVAICFAISVVCGAYGIFVVGAKGEKKVEPRPPAEVFNEVEIQEEVVYDTSDPEAPLPEWGKRPIGVFKTENIRVKMEVPSKVIERRREAEKKGIPSIDLKISPEDREKSTFGGTAPDYNPEVVPAEEMDSPKYRDLRKKK